MEKPEKVVGGYLKGLLFYPHPNFLLTSDYGSYGITRGGGAHSSAYILQSRFHLRADQSWESFKAALSQSSCVDSKDNSTREIVPRCIQLRSVDFHNRTQIPSCNSRVGT